MKTGLFILSALLCAVSCNTKPKSAEVTATPIDTIAAEKDTVFITQQSSLRQQTRTTSSTGANNTASETMSATSGNEAQAKKGWSKTAKGAVIGGVVGAGTGAVVYKKNRAAGAVVGGVIGAGGGAIIGNELDKKDGRH
jgi:hypothetical protein